MIKPKYKIRDWVRFYSSGKIVIGEVNYINKNIVSKYTYSTDSGAVGEEYILESRSTGEDRQP